MYCAPLFGPIYLIHHYIVEHSLLCGQDSSKMSAPSMKWSHAAKAFSNKTEPFTGSVHFIAHFPLTASFL